ncbi:hypothetical protein N7495_009889 [Penicillium taxi]|uniref:uncharacterized protein n=1 Tax=Penicillium taxi TaxID=168475 RepID=UPI002544F1DC|nr:uncharacterized protein N7495_009889 [Penicillium taxi]KAJ5885379.1 hypothetical protein N7495_009889 [Penicillium taxi]
MYSSFVARVGLVLAAISATTSMGLSVTPFHQDLKLSAQMGISPDVMLIQKKSIHEIAHESDSDNINSEYVDVPVDHGNSSLGTYQNRYWVSDKYYQQGGPVFIYDVGEASAESSARIQLGNDSSLLASMLFEFGAMGIVWEHRYYGDSLPFPVTNDTPPGQFEFLNNRQALADIPFFAETFSHPSYKNVDLTPSATPWVMVGGSYSGMRAAFTRHEYPETIFASFASSAPVEARIDMSIYFEQVYAAMVSNGRFNCTRDIKAAYEWIDGELEKNESTAAEVKKLFFGEGAEVNSNGDFTAALSGVYGFFQAYGLGGGEGGLGALCEHMETDESGEVAGPHGFAPSQGKEYAARRFASWPVFVELINVNYNTNCGQLDPDQPLECALNPKATDPDTIAWTWQFCTEWGYYQSNNVGPHSLLSRYQTLDYIQYTCNRQFPEAVEENILPKQAEVDKTNYQTGGWNIRPSNVYWSGGQFDPWRTLSTLATESIAPQDVTFTTDIPKCNVETGEKIVFGYIMENAEHCFDFRMNFAPGNTSRGIFHEALTEWLPCFSPIKAITA